MPKAREKTKSKEKRLQEKEKVDAETQRSLAVARMKEAHKAIEDIEKIRKRSAVRSVCQRMGVWIKDIRIYCDMLLKPPFSEVPVLAENAKRNILDFA